MVVVIKEEASNTVASGVVISQNPIAGTPLDPGTEITIVVSTGNAPPLKMPYVVGMTEVEARAELSGKELNVTVDYDVSDSIPNGSVISQSIPAGTVIRIGDTVTITVSSGDKRTDDSIDAPDLPPGITLSKIEVTPPAKTTYNVGESFNSSGMFVTATYSDNKTKTVTSLCTTSGFDSSSSGTKTVTVSYTEEGTTKTATFSIVVNATVTTIQIDQAKIITSTDVDEYFLEIYFTVTNPNGLLVEDLYFCPESSYEGDKVSSMNMNEKIIDSYILVVFDDGGSERRSGLTYSFRLCITQGENRYYSDQWSFIIP